MSENVMLETILLVVLVLLPLPSWGYSTNWGYGPSGLLRCSSCRWSNLATVVHRKCEGRLRRKAAFSCGVPSMNASLEVEVFYPA